MKRMITLVLAALLLLTMASCGKKVEPATEPVTEPTTQPTTEPTETTEATIPAPTEPEWEPAISRASYAEVLYTILEKGTEVNVLGQFKDYYIIEGSEVDLLVEKRFIRMDSEDAFEQWDGYARNGIEIFDNVYMRGDAIATLKTNTKVQVLEGKGDWLYIRWDDQEGYTHVDNISKTKIKRGGGGGAGGSGPVDGTGFDFGSLSVVDGNWSVTLLGAYYGPEMEKTADEDTFVPGMGKVIAHDVEAYITLFLRDSEVKVTAKTEETVTVWLDEEYYGDLPRWIVRMEGDEPYESWTGYAKNKSGIYEEYQMRNELQQLKTNTTVTVLDELPTCYVVELDGQVGYMKLDSLSKTKIVGGKGGNGGGGGSGTVWTPPAM